MAELLVRLPDDLARELRTEAHGNVSAFVAEAVRHELERRRLYAFVTERDDELGTAGEAGVRP